MQTAFWAAVRGGAEVIVAAGAEANEASATGGEVLTKAAQGPDGWNDPSKGGDGPVWDPGLSNRVSVLNDDMSESEIPIQLGIQMGAAPDACRAGFIAP